MGKETKFQAIVIIQDGIDNKELGRKYLIQVDTEILGKRFFIDATNLVLRSLEGSLPKEGEFWLDANNLEVDGYGNIKS